MVIRLIITLCVSVLLITVAFFIRFEFVKCTLNLLFSLLLVAAGLVFYLMIREWDTYGNLLFTTSLLSGQTNTSMKELLLIPLTNGAFLMGLWAMVFLLFHNLTNKK